MANSTATFREVRFVIEDELTQAYVLIEAGGDSPIGVQGWHHKTFPPSKSIVDIISGFAGDESPILWAQKAPN
jgi:hypothetical protein